MQYQDREQQRQESEQYQWKAEETPQQTDDSRCPNCGAHIESNQKFCEECGNPLGGGQCPYCQHAIEPGLALCPYCGRSVSLNSCSFCGEQMELGERFCSSCGNPREGIACPTCGALNFRSFCHNCNTPLNQMAVQAIEKAHKHPAVIQARHLNVEMESLQQEMENLLTILEAGEETESPVAVSPFGDEPEMTEEDRCQLERFYSLLNKKVELREHKRPSAPTPPPVQRRNLTRERKQRMKQLMAEYEAKEAQMRNTIAAMVPDPAAPPEEQRNFLCACLVETYSTIIVKEKKPIEWVCNLCGCHHRQPSECARPELGGTWLYQETERIKKIKKTSTIYM